MKIWRYRLTGLGKLGAFLFIAPTPIAGFYALPTRKPEGRVAYEQALRSVGGDIPMPSPTVLILLATASLIGLVLLLIGRELIED